MVKRLFDFFFSILGLSFLGWVIIVFWLLVSLDTRSNGFFIQRRIGQWGKPFSIFKLKTICPKKGHSSAIGKFLRKSKLDELPQLFNILKGDMSVVGPRPDIAGYYDLLEGENRKILELKPGLTSLASIKYFNEEALLSEKENPIQFNDQVIFPDKVQLNLKYYYERSFFGDIKIIWKTVFRK